MIKTTAIGLVAAFYVVNALGMLLAPEPWYHAVPGVTATGPLNTHFVRDIGFIYLLSGIALTLGLRRPANPQLWFALGTAWPLLHGLFHIGEWFSHGLPPNTVLVAELAAVIAPVAIGLWACGTSLAAARTAPIVT